MVSCRRLIKKSELIKLFGIIIVHRAVSPAQLQKETRRARCPARWISYDDVSTTTSCAPSLFFVDGAAMILRRVHTNMSKNGTKYELFRRSESSRSWTSSQCDSTLRFVIPQRVPPVLQLLNKLSSWRGKGKALQQ